MSKQQNTADDIRNAVRENYAAVARTNSGCLPSEGDSGCCGTGVSRSESRSLGVGYSETEMAAVPEDSNMGLGCGNPTAIAGLKVGQTVVDLGSGGGFDCFLAARQVGPSGRVIGVDMTPDMIDKARRNADKVEADNVEFRLGEIEHLPVADNSVDVIISNCVINLSPDKAAVYRDAFRVLRSGGRLVISDVVARVQPPEELANDLRMISGCVGGAATVAEITGWLEAEGYGDISVSFKEEVAEAIDTWVPGRKLSDYVGSATIEAGKP
ncbi:MAG: arsenite methyltransferase [Alphaproteobacteria bacterium]|jgi:SAM-dependent methyltransferase|nr:arsenite methyltransferase [Alphaproteobacteria bacterium]